MAKQFAYCPDAQNGVGGCIGCYGRDDCKAVYIDAPDPVDPEAIKDAGGCAFLDIPETPQAYAKRKSAENDARALQLQYQQNNVQDVINRR